MIKPRRGTVLVREDRDEGVSKGGIIMPGSDKKMKTGFVLEVGENPIGKKGKVREMGIKKGDKIHFKQGFGKPWRDGQVWCRFVHFEEILCIED